jgi:hypothetical protein
MTNYEYQLRKFYESIKKNEANERDSINALLYKTATIDFPPGFFSDKPSCLKIYSLLRPVKFLKENFERKLPYNERVKLFEKMKEEGLKEGIVSSDDETLQHLYPRKTFFEKIQEHLKK